MNARMLYLLAISPQNRLSKPYSLGLTKLYSSRGSVGLIFGIDKCNCLQKIAFIVTSIERSQSIHMVALSLYLTERGFSVLVLMRCLRRTLSAISPPISPVSLRPVSARRLSSYVMAVLPLLRTP